MANNKLAIIGGSGLYDIDEFREREFLKLETPWGKPSDEILKTKYHDKEIFFYQDMEEVTQYLLRISILELTLML